MNDLKKNMFHPQHFLESRYIRIPTDFLPKIQEALKGSSGFSGTYVFSEQEEDRRKSLQDDSLFSEIYQNTVLTVSVTFPTGKQPEVLFHLKDKDTQKTLAESPAPLSFYTVQSDEESEYETLKNAGVEVPLTREDLLPTCSDKLTFTAKNPETSEITDFEAPVYLYFDGHKNAYADAYAKCYRSYLVNILHISDPDTPYIGEDDDFNWWNPNEE